MSKISKEVITEAVQRLIVSTNNKIWGIFSLIACSNSDTEIKLNNTYLVDSKKLSNLLGDLFYFGNTDRNPSQDSAMSFKLSTKFPESVQKYIGKEQILLADVAIFFFKSREFAEPIEFAYLINELKSTLKLSDSTFEQVFDCTIPDSIIPVEENYTKQELFEKIKSTLNIDTTNTTLTFEGTNTVQAHPSEITRGPYIQPLYASLQIQELILLSNINLDGYYPKIDISKTEIDYSLNTIFFGAPGTGKSYKIENILADIPEVNKYRVSFHPEYDYYSFIGGFKPISEKEENGSESIKYKFVPQAFTEIYIKAWNDLENKYFLAIEEINRGNCAEIFGDLFQLLDRNSNYSISPTVELQQYLESKLSEEGKKGIEGGKMKLPSNLILLASMNTSDQSLFPMDSAFKRRWHWEYVPICYEEQNDDESINKSYFYEVKIDEDTSFKWIEFIFKVNEVIKGNPNLGMDKCIGNYFVKAIENEINIKEFINKVIFYLWNDVFKDEENEVFPTGTSYEDFFPILSKGKAKLIVLLKNLDVNVIVSN